MEMHAMYVCTQWRVSEASGALWKASHAHSVKQYRGTDIQIQISRMHEPLAGASIQVV